MADGAQVTMVLLADWTRELPQGIVEHHRGDDVEISADAELERLVSLEAVAAPDTLEAMEAKDPDWRRRLRIESGEDIHDERLNIIYPASWGEPPWGRYSYPW